MIFNLMIDWDSVTISNTKKKKKKKCFSSSDTKEGREKSDSVNVNKRR